VERAARSTPGPQRFSVRASGAPAPAPTPAVTARLAAHFLQQGLRPDGHERVLASSDAVLRTMRQAIDAGYLDLALELIRVAEPAFALGARWAAWGETLELAVTAAVAKGDRAAQGWARHQQGIRAMALGDQEEARAHLTHALAIRCALGALEDVELTAQQLALLPAPAADADTPEP
jgi:hypothetical protein